MNAMQLKVEVDLLQICRKTEIKELFEKARDQGPVHYEAFGQGFWAARDVIYKYEDLLNEIFEEAGLLKGPNA